MLFRSLDHSKTIWIVVILFIAVSVFVWLGNHKTVSLGEEFTLRPGQVVRIADTELKMALEKIIDVQCHTPEAIFEICGPTGITQFEYQGKTYSYLPADIPFTVEFGTIETNRAVFSVYRVDDCVDRGDRCWQSAASRLRNPDLCVQIRNDELKNECFEYLASVVGISERGLVCSRVSDPKHFCQYWHAVDQNNIEQCAKVVDINWRRQCFRDVINKVGKDYKACVGLKASLYSECVDSVRNWVLE